MSLHIPMQKAGQVVKGRSTSAPGTIRVSELERALYDALKHRYQNQQRVTAITKQSLALLMSKGWGRCSL